MIWQYVFVGILVAAAAAYLVRCIVLASRASSGGGCGGGCRCNDAAKAASDRLGRKRELVQLGSREGGEHGSDTTSSAAR